MAEEQMDDMRNMKKKRWLLTGKLDAVGWGIVFIWAALILLAQITGMADDWSWWNGWGIFFIGAGLITILTTLVRLNCI